jgi:hypothetical protein
MSLMNSRRFIADPAPMRQRMQFSTPVQAVYVRSGSMLSKKSFGGNKRNFSGLLMRFARGDMRDHIVSYKNDHGASYKRYKRT